MVWLHVKLLVAVSQFIGGGTRGPWPSQNFKFRILAPLPDFNQGINYVVAEGSIT